MCTILLTLNPILHLPMTFDPTSRIFHYPLPARLAQALSVGNNPYATLIPHGTRPQLTASFSLPPERIRTNFLSSCCAPTCSTPLVRPAVNLSTQEWDDMSSLLHSSMCRADHVIRYRLNFALFVSACRVLFSVKIMFHF